MKSKRESGLVVVEAAIVVTLVMIILTIMLYVGMVLYQQTLISVMANQTAANIAQVYSNNLKDPFTGYVDPERVYQSITYSNMKTDAYMAVVEQKANIFAQYRLKSSAILAGDSASVEVDVVKKPNELLKSQVVVTVRDHYDVPLVGFFGANGLMEFAASGRADCVDILDYINGVEAIGDPEDSSVSYLPDSKNCVITFVPDPDAPSNMQVQTVLKGHSIISSNKYTRSVMPSDPKKGNLEFAGWYTERGSKFVASTQVNENITVYARWMCEVVLDAKGGTVNGKTRDVKKVIYGEKTSLSNPSRAGYISGGWFDASGKQYVSNDTPIMDNVTLQPKWICTHDYKLQRSDAATCVKRGVNYYRCVRCNHEKQETGGYGGHDMQYNGVVGDLCYQRTVQYKCSRCNTYTTSGNGTGGRHSYNAGAGHRRCNVAHGCSGFRCSTAGWNASLQTYNYCGAKHYWHATCVWCGARRPKTPHYYQGKLVTGDELLCGVHNAGRAATGCGHSGTKK